MNTVAVKDAYLVPQMDGISRLIRRSAETSMVEANPGYLQLNIDDMDKGEQRCTEI